MASRDNDSKGRTPPFARNPDLERLLRELNQDLRVAEEHVLEKLAGKAPFPLVLIVGPLRSGTTLMLQWLSNTGLVACPTNLLSRFYGAPVIGAKIQQLLTDPRYNFRDELGDFSGKLTYESENGKSQGVLAPNEFWYFWRRFLPDPSRDVWSDDELREGIDGTSLKAELHGMMAVFGKPFAAKAMLFNYNLPVLHALFDDVVFLHVSRDPVATVASILAARRRQLGDESAWYSFRIPEYQQLKNLDPVSQAAGQHHFIERAVSLGLAAVPPRDQLHVRYEDFCGNPAAIFRQLAERLGVGDAPYDGPARFDNLNAAEPENRQAIEAALQSFTAN